MELLADEECELNGVACLSAPALFVLQGLRMLDTPRVQFVNEAKLVIWIFFLLFEHCQLPVLDYKYIEHRGDPATRSFAALKACLMRTEIYPKPIP